MARKDTSHINSPGDADHWAGNDWTYQNKYLTGTDQSATDPANIATNTTFWDNRLRVYNPARTFSARFRTLALTADLDVTIPLTSGVDTLTLINLAQELMNKTYNLSNNSLTATGANLGAIPRFNGTKFVHQNVGTPGQVPTVNVGGTDWTWANPSATASLADNSVAENHIQNNAVTDVKLAGSISGTKMAAGAIGTTQLADLGITTAKIADANVTNAKLAGSISNDKLSQITDKTKLPSDIVYSGSGAGVFGGTLMANAGYIGGRISPTDGGFGLFRYLTKSGPGSGGAEGAGTGTLGTYWFIGTGTTVNTRAGEKTTSAVTLIDLLPEFFIRFYLDNNTVMRYFAGIANVSDIPTATDGPLDGQSGFGIQVDQGFSTFKICHNDGDATDDNDTTTVTIPTATPVSFYFKVVSTTQIDWKIWTTNNGDVTLPPAEVGSVTTELPATGTQLLYHNAINNQTATDIYLGRYVTWIKNKW